MPFFVPGDLDLCPLTLTFKLDQAGNKHVFCVNLVDIRSVVPKIFHRQTKKNHRLTAIKNRTFRRSLGAAKICAAEQNYRNKKCVISMLFQYIFTDHFLDQVLQPVCCERVCVYVCVHTVVTV